MDRGKKVELCVSRSEIAFFTLSKLTSKLSSQLPFIKGTKPENFLSITFSNKKSFRIIRVAVPEFTVPQRQGKDGDWQKIYELDLQTPPSHIGEASLTGLDI